MSEKYTLSKKARKKWFQNLLMFSAPALAIFFAQLASGVELKVALSVALFALYAALADLFKKYSSGK